MQTFINLTEAYKLPKHVGTATHPTSSSSTSREHLSMTSNSQSPRSTTSSATSNTQSARSSLSSVSPLPAPNQLVDTSEDEEDREEDREEEEEEEAHIHVQEPKIPLMNTDTIERVKKRGRATETTLISSEYLYSQSLASAQRPLPKRKSSVSYAGLSKK